MTDTTLLIIWIQTAICFGFALAISLLFKKSVASRAMTFKVALLAGLIVAVISPFVSTRSEPIVMINLPTVKRDSRLVPIPLSPTGKAISEQRPAYALAPAQSDSLDVRSREIVSSTSLAKFSNLGFAIYLPGLMVLTASLVFGIVSIFRLRARSSELQRGALFDALSEISDRNQIRLPLLLASQEVRIPFVTGVFRKQIYIPASWQERDDLELLIPVLEHEVAHIVAKDLEWKLLGRLANMVLWMQPLTWIINRKMADASEEICDQRVLATGVSGQKYAKALLSVRDEAMQVRVPSLVIGAMSRKSTLVKRLRAILDERLLREQPLSRRNWYLVLGALALSTLLSAFLIAQPVRDSGKLGQLGFYGAYEGEVVLTDWNRQPVTNARAWLLGLSDGNRKTTLTSLNVRGNRIEVKGIPEGQDAGTLVLLMADGSIDFKGLWPMTKKVTQLEVRKPTSIRGRFTFPFQMTGPIRVKVTGLVHEQFLPLWMMPTFDRSAVIDKNGYFKVEGLPSDCEVMFEVDDDRIAKESQALRIKIDKKSYSDFFEHSLKLAGSIEGRVLRDGKPVAGLGIAAQGQNHSVAPSEWSESVTDSEGRYRLTRLTPATYNVAPMISDPLARDVTAVAHEGVSVQAGISMRGHDFNLIPGGILSGVVINGAGRAVPNAEVGIYGPAHPNTSAWVGSAKTDSRGRFSARVPAGMNYAYYMGNAWGGATNGTQVRDGEEVHIKLGVLQQDSSNMRPTNANLPYGPIRLKSGKVIRLDYLCRDGARGFSAWLPDGRPTDIVQKKDGVDARSFSTAFEKSGEIVVRASLTNDMEGTSRFSVDNLLGAWTSSSNSRTNTTELALLVNSDDEERSSIRIGIPFGQYQQWYKGRVRAIDRLKTEQTTHQIIYVAIPDELIQKDLKISAWDSQGQPLLPGVFETKRNEVTKKRMFTFESEAAIDTIQIQYRDMEWVTFGNIHMQPND